MAKLYSVIETAGKTFRSDREMDDADVVLMIQAYAGDQAIGFVETVIQEPVLDSEGNETGEFTPRTQRDPATPDQIWEALTSRAFNQLLTESNSYRLEAKKAEKIAEAEAEFQPISAVTP